MKRIKKILLLFLIILLSGCSVEYNLTINNDSTVNEKVVAKEVTNRMKSNTGVSEDQSVNYLYKMFDRNNLDTNIITTTRGSTTISTVTGDHDTLEDYVNNFSSDVFESPVLTKEKNIVTLTFDQSKILSSTASRSLIYDDITVNITLPYKVIDHNADKYKKNTYTWEIKKDENLRQIMIQYDKTDLIDAKEFSFGKFNFQVKYTYIAVGVIILVVAAIVLVVYLNNKKNNKI